MGNSDTQEAEILIFFFFTCWKYRISHLSHMENKNCKLQEPGISQHNLRSVNHSFLELAHWHTFFKTLTFPFGVTFCPPVWTASVPQTQSDQVWRALAQKEAPPSTALSSPLITRVLKPLGLKWCTSIGRDGGPRCPKVMCHWGIFQEICPNPLRKQGIATPEL